MPHYGIPVLKKKYENNAIIGSLFRFFIISAVEFKPLPQTRSAYSAGKILRMASFLYQAVCLWATFMNLSHYIDSPAHLLNLNSTSKMSDLKAGNRFPDGVEFT